MNCRDLHEVVDAFVMDELPPHTAHEVLQHVQRCSSCRADVASMRTQRAALKAAFESSAALAPTSDLHARLRESLRSEARTDAAGGRLSFETTRRRKVAYFALAAAASILIAGAVVAWNLRVGAFVRDVAAAAVGDHRLCNIPFRLPERPVALPEAAVRYGAIYSVYERVPTSVITIPSRPIHIVGRHVCEYAGRRFVHLVLQDRDQRLSVMITDVNRTLAAFIQPAVEVRRMEDVDGMTVATFRTGRHLVFVTGVAPSRDLEALATAIAKPLDEVLSGL